MKRRKSEISTLLMLELSPTGAQRGTARLHPSREIERILSYVTVEIPPQYGCC
jgi:hypothetical protein